MHYNLQKRHYLQKIVLKIAMIRQNRHSGQNCFLLPKPNLDFVVKRGSYLSEDYYRAQQIPNRHLGFLILASGIHRFQKSSQDRCTKQQDRTSRC